MRASLLSLLVAGVLVFEGCSSRQTFEPEQTFSASMAQSEYDGTIVNVTRDGATLENGHYIDKNGISRFGIGEGYRYLGEYGKYLLAGDAKGVLQLIDRKSGKLFKEIDMGIPVVSASLKGNLIAYILDNNAFGLYDIAHNRKIIENRSERTYAIDVRAASPLFVDSLVVMPMLDGKLVIFDTRDPENAKVVYLSSETAFNNVIYLERTGDTLVAATPKRLLTLGSEGEYDYRANIADVSIYKNRIYLFTKEGEIIKMSIALDTLATKKFKFAQFSESTVVDGKVYALDIQGSLIVLDSDLKKYRIYDVGEVENPVFVSGSKLYKDGTIIHLDKLGYQ